MKTDSPHLARFLRRFCLVPTITRRLFAACLALGMALPGLPSLAEEEINSDAGTGGLEVIRREADGILTVSTTFEGGGHLQPIASDTDGWIPGTGIRMAGHWVTSTSPPKTFSNNPSGNTIATWLTSASVQTIHFQFAEPVSEVFLHFAAAGGVTLMAVDADGNQVGDLVNGVGTGLPFSNWQQLSVSAPTNVIAAVLVFGPSDGETGVDDVGYHRYVAIEVPIDVKPGNDNEIDPISLKANGALPLAVFSTPEFDATTLDPSTLALGDSQLVQIATIARGSAEDVDGDGLLDVVLHFSASELVDGGAINANTTELLLTGGTTDGKTVFGKDQVRILGGGK